TTKIAASPPRFHSGRAEYGPQLLPRADAKLGIHAPQVPLDRPRAKEQLGTDLRIRQSLRGEPRDLRLLRGEVGAGLVGALARRLAGTGQLAPCAFGEHRHADGAKHVVGRAELLPRIEPSALPSQPFAVDEMCTRKIRTGTGKTQSL